MASSRRSFAGAKNPDTTQTPSQSEPSRNQSLGLVTQMDITPDEIMVFCMARQVNDGEIVAQGLATPLVTAAYLLARQTHAPIYI